MRTPSRRIRTDPAPGADPRPAGGAPFAEGDGDGSAARRAEVGDDRTVDFGAEGIDVARDEATLDNADALRAERPPHYA